MSSSRSIDFWVLLLWQGKTKSTSSLKTLTDFWQCWKRLSLLLEKREPFSIFIYLLLKQTKNPNSQIIKMAVKTRSSKMNEVFDKFSDILNYIIIINNGINMCIMLKGHNHNFVLKMTQWIFFHKFNILGPINHVYDWPYPSLQTWACSLWSNRNKTKRFNRGGLTKFIFVHN